jgi:hypothetical protein
LATAIMLQPVLYANKWSPKKSPLNFFFRWKRFPLRNSTGRFHRLIPPPIHKRFGRATGSEDIIMNKYLSPLRMASVCISSVSVPYSSAHRSWNGVVRQLVGFSDGHETYVQFLSDHHPEEKPRLSTPMTLFFYLSAMKPGFRHSLWLSGQLTRE